MKIINSIDQYLKLREKINLGSTGFVPTMGALHEGHKSLVRRSIKECDTTVVSIYVNPTQFNNATDLANYPDTIDKDIETLESLGNDFLFLPTFEEIYPDKFRYQIEENELSTHLCGAHRKGHFTGVLTIVMKLLNIVRPFSAYFGEKDYQQLSVMRQMVRDLDLPLEIVGCPTVREADGLAMSSRNAYLSNDERKAAVAIYTAITDVAQQIELGADIDGASQSARQALQAAGFGQIDYVAVRDAESLEAVTSVTDRPLRVLAAAWLGKTRLIDNVAAGPGSSR